MYLNYVPKLPYLWGIKSCSYSVIKYLVYVIIFNMINVLCNDVSTFQSVCALPGCFL